MGRVLFFSLFIFFKTSILTRHLKWTTRVASVRRRMRSEAWMQPALEAGTPLLLPGGPWGVASHPPGLPPPTTTTTTTTSQMDRCCLLNAALLSISCQNITLSLLPCKTETAADNHRCLSLKENRQRFTSDINQFKSCVHFLFVPSVFPFFDFSELQIKKTGATIITK